MRMRKKAVRRSSRVSTQAGGDGMACEVEDVEPLSLVVVVFEVEILGSGKVGADKDIASGLGCRCMRGSIIAEMCRRGMGTQEVLVDLVVYDWMAGEENAVMKSKAARRRWDFILGNLGGGKRR